MRKLLTGAMSALLLTAGLGLYPATVPPVAAFSTCLRNEAPGVVRNAFAFALVNYHHSQVDPPNPAILEKYTLVAPDGKETILWSGNDAEIPDADSMIFDVWGVAPGRYSIKEWYSLPKAGEHEYVMGNCYVSGDATPDTRFGFSVEGRGQWYDEYARMPRCARNSPVVSPVRDAYGRLVIDEGRRASVTVRSRDSEWCVNRAVRVSAGGATTRISLSPGEVESVGVTVPRATAGQNQRAKVKLTALGKRSTKVVLTLVPGTAGTRTTP